MASFSWDRVGSRVYIYNKDESQTRPVAIARDAAVAEQIVRALNGGLPDEWLRQLFDGPGA